jgi:hypothetical protein
MPEEIQDFPEPDTTAETEEQSEEVSPPTTEAPPDQAPSSTDSSESTLPPEAQGEVNGGPLGCCLGVMIGLLLSLSIALLARFYAEPLVQIFQGSYGAMAVVVRILMGAVAVAAAIFCGYLGWRIGRRIYREYDQPAVQDRRQRSQSKKLQQKI